MSLGKSPEILMEHRKYKVRRISIFKLQGKKKKIARHHELGAPQYSVGDAWEVGMGVVVSITGFDLFCPGKFIMAQTPCPHLWQLGPLSEPTVAPGKYLTDLSPRDFRQRQVSWPNSELNTQEASG